MQVESCYYSPDTVENFNSRVQELFLGEEFKSQKIIESSWDDEENKNSKLNTIPLTPPIVQIGIVQDMCDLRCNQCWLPRLIATGDARPKIMDMGLYQKVIDQVAMMDKEYGSKTPIRYLGSGESLLDPSLIEKIDYTKKHLEGPVALITNGHRLTYCRKGRNISLAQELLDVEIDLIDVSIDATNNQVYQQLRGDAQHTYGDLAQNLLELLGLRNRGNYPTTLMGSFLLQPENYLQADMFVATWGHILDKYIFRKYHSYRGHIQSKPHPEIEIRKPCAAPFGRLNITADGIATGCYLDWQKEMMIADFNDKDINIIDVWQGPMKQMQEAHICGKFPDFCKNCDGYAAAHFGALSYEVAIRNATKSRLEKSNVDIQQIKERIPSAAFI